MGMGEGADRRPARRCQRTQDHLPFHQGRRARSASFQTAEVDPGHYPFADFSDGVSDIAALRKLLEAGAAIRGIRNLHAKLYLFGGNRAIITSANLTEAALGRNHEIGMVADDQTIIATCRHYFDDLWRRSAPDLVQTQVDAWDQIVTAQLALGGRPNQAIGLGDFGADAGINQPPPTSLPAVVADAQQAFVKFLGHSRDRVPSPFPTFAEIKRAGCHWALGYPANLRPRAVKDGAVISLQD
jgi:hypothetical protein